MNRERIVILLFSYLNLRAQRSHSEKHSIECISYSRDSGIIKTIMGETLWSLLHRANPIPVLRCREAVLSAGGPGCRRMCEHGLLSPFSFIVSLV